MPYTSLKIILNLVIFAEKYIIETKNISSITSCVQ